MSLLRAALERAAATMRGGMQPPNFDMTGMFNPQAMASQGQPGLQPTPNAQVDNRFPGSPNDQVAARFGGMQPPSQTPNQYVAQNFPEPAPQRVPVTGGSYDYSGNSAKLSDMAAGHAYRPERSPAVTPTPMAQPASAPQGMGFFQRNAAMMTDPVTGMFIDPTAAAQAQASGGDVIKKMLGLLHNKAG